MFWSRGLWPRWNESSLVLVETEENPSSRSRTKEISFIILQHYKTQTHRTGIYGVALPRPDIDGPPLEKLFTTTTPAKELLESTLLGIAPRVEQRSITAGLTVGIGSYWAQRRSLFAQGWCRLVR